MTPTEFLRSRNIVAKNKSDLMIGFDNGTEESLIELLETYHKAKLDLLNIPIVSKRIDFKADEIAFILKLVQWNIDYAPEENTANEIDLTNRIQTKLIM